MGIISKQDFSVLNDYKFISDECVKSGKNRQENDQLLCLKGGRLATVNRSDATAWNFVKKFFGCGKLAGATLSLRKISNYLAQKDLAKIASETPAYQTLHGIAARCLLYQKDKAQLWKKIGSPLQVTVEESRKKYYSWRPYRSPTYSRSGESTLTVYTTHSACLSHLKTQVETAYKTQGKTVFECEPIGSGEWIHEGYRYEGHERGYVYQQPYLYIPTLSGHEEVSQVASFRFRCVTDVSLPYQVPGYPGCYF